MKRILLLLLLIIFNSISAQSTASGTYIICDGNPVVLSVAPNASAYMWNTGSTTNTYIATQAGSYSVTVEGTDGSIQTYTFTVLDEASVLLSDGFICKSYLTGEEEPYTINTGLNEGNYNFTWSYNGVVLPATTPSLAVTLTGEYTVTITNGSGCTISDSVIISYSGTASPVGMGYVVNGEDVAINVQGYGVYDYQIDNSPSQESNVFTNIEYGMHTVTVTDRNGCGSLFLNFANVVPYPPQGATDQTFIEGETLANLEVSGEAIKWYAAPGAEAGRSTPDDNDIPLPMSTLLSNNTTYYASQTINGIESIARFPVTAHLTMGTEEETLAGFTYQPNPVKDVLHISGATNINAIVIYNMLGQTVYHLTPNSNNATVNFSFLSNGIYNVKIISNGKAKLARIVKN